MESLATEKGQKPTSAPTTGKGLNIALWVVQALLALGFLMAGGMKLFTPYADVAEHMHGIPEGLFRFIGVAEVAGALGMILPAATRTMPKLTGLAGVGLMAVMILATGFHAMHGEWSSTPVTILLGLMGAFVAWGRLFKAPIAPR